MKKQRFAVTKIPCTDKIIKGIRCKEFYFQDSYGLEFSDMDKRIVFDEKDQCYYIEEGGEIPLFTSILDSKYGKMKFSDSYYSVYSRMPDPKTGEFVEREVEFNENTELMRFKREEAKKLFFNLISWLNALNDKSGTVIEFIFYEFYVEHDHENGISVDVERFSRNVLFSLKDGNLTVDYFQWRREAELVLRNSEVIIGKMAIVKPKFESEGLHVWDDDLCWRMGIPFEYPEWE